MSMNKEVFEALLAQMRSEFLMELPDRCDDFEEHILTLQQSPENEESFNVLYRGVHSLKGSGGTHGLPVITTICHQLENLLSETNARHDFGAPFVESALVFVDLLRQIEVVERQNPPDYSVIEAKLEEQRSVTLQQRRPVLVIESSKVMAGLCQKALDGMDLQLAIVDDGLVALGRLLNEPYELIIVGRELKTLNGIPLMAALRNSQCRNHDAPALLLTNRQDGIPEYVSFHAIISRDRHLSENLRDAVGNILKLAPCN